MSDLGLKPSGLEYIAFQETNELVTLHPLLHSTDLPMQPSGAQMNRGVPGTPQIYSFIYMGDHSIDMIHQYKVDHSEDNNPLPSLQSHPNLQGAHRLPQRKDSLNGQMNPKCLWDRLNPFFQDKLLITENKRLDGLV